jgi:DNA-binding PadR family transcriptional regulator
MRLWVSKRRQEAEVLAAIRDGHRYGFGIMRATGLGARRVFPTLKRLEQDGRVASALETPAPAGRPARLLYELVEAAP